jgi:hypothetical protein
VSRSQDGRPVLQPLSKTTLSSSSFQSHLINYFGYCYDRLLRRGRYLSDKTTQEKGGEWPRSKGKELDRGSTSASSSRDQSYTAPAIEPTLQNYQANIIGNDSGNFTANNYNNTYNYLSGGRYPLIEHQHTES